MKKQPIKKLTVRLPGELVDAVKIYSVKIHAPMEIVVAQALDLYLKRRGERRDDLALYLKQRGHRRDDDDNAA